LKELRFIHTADLHLDSPFLGLDTIPKDLFKRLQESTFTAFERVVDHALQEAVDFVLISGDLFDGADRSIKAQARLRKQLERLGSKGINTFIIHGNHDHLAGDWVTLEMPSQVHIFSERVEQAKFTAKNGSIVHIYGFSYPKQHVLERKIEEYKKEPQADFHIGMLHGSEDSIGSGHQPYAPFSLAELLEKKMDYWALGHIHKKQILHKDPYIIYPGNIQGRHRKESGEKGCYLVTLKEQGLSEIKFIETADIRWESIHINIEKEIGLQGLYSTCMREMEKLACKNQGLLGEIILNDVDKLSRKLLKTIENGEFIELLQEDIMMDNEFIWPYRIQYETVLGGGTEEMSDDVFLKLLDETVTELGQGGNFERAVSDLFSHTYASRYIRELDEFQKKEILIGAKNLIMHQLSKND